MWFKVEASEIEVTRSPLALTYGAHGKRALAGDRTGASANAIMSAPARAPHALDVSPIPRNLTEFDPHPRDPMRVPPLAAQGSASAQACNRRQQ